MLALLVLALPIITQFNTPPGRVEATQYRTGNLLVRMNRSTPEQARALHAAAGSTNVSSIPQLGIQIVQVPDGRMEHARSVFANSPAVDEVSFDYVTESAAGPNDPYYIDGTQWALQKMNSEPAWGLTTGSGATIAILDSGIDTAHPDLQAGKQHFFLATTSTTATPTRMMAVVTVLMWLELPPQAATTALGSPESPSMPRFCQSRLSATPAPETTVA